VRAAVYLDPVLTPSPRPSGERVGVRGLSVGLLSPALSSLGEEREKNSFKMCVRAAISTPRLARALRFWYSGPRD
jgi:hypothetical protein